MYQQCYRHDLFFKVTTIASKKNTNKTDHVFHPIPKTDHVYHPIPKTPKNHIYWYSFMQILASKDAYKFPQIKKPCR